MLTQMNQIIEDTRFREVLALQGLELQQFYQEIPSQQLFVPAESHPEFFNENLVSPNRILKHFVNDPQSNIRIFYYQLLRLGYEIQLEAGNNQDFIINLRRMVFHPEFQILFSQQSEDQRNLFNDFQFKKLFAEFITLLDEEQLPNIEQFLCHYPIMDTIFIHIFRSLLASQNINQQFDSKIPTQVVFGQLATLFELSITSYGNCWKFEDSDMFCYQQKQDTLFLAYIVDDGSSQFQEEGQVNQAQQFKSQNPINPQSSNVAFDDKIHPDAVIANSNIIVPPNSDNRNLIKNYANDNNNKIPDSSHQSSNVQNLFINNPNQVKKESLNKINNNSNSQGSAQISVNAINQIANYGQITKHSEQPTGFQNKYEALINRIQNTIKQNYQGYSTSSKSKHNDTESKNISKNNQTKPSDYFSNRYQVDNNSKHKIQSYNTIPLEAKSIKTNLKTDMNSEYKSESSPYTTNYNSIKCQVLENYDQSSKAAKSINVPELPAFTKQYEPKIVPIFKPVELTKLPSFDSYNTNNTFSTKNYNRYSTSDHPIYQYKPQFQSSSFEVKDYSTYVPSTRLSISKDFEKDFTPPNILQKLRSQNRQNINRIRQSMKGIQRGLQLPTGVHVREQISNIYSSNSLPSREFSYSYGNGFSTSYSNNHQWKPHTPDIGSSSSYKLYEDYNFNSQDYNLCRISY